MKSTLTLATLAVAATLATATAFGEDRTLNQLVEEYNACTNTQQRLSFRKAMTTAEWRTIADRMLSVYAKDKDTGRKICGKWDVLQAMGHQFKALPEASALAEEYDPKFRDAKLCAMPLLYRKLPLSTEYFLSVSTGAYAVVCRRMLPVRISMIRKYKTPYLNPRKIEFGEAANLLAEYAASYVDESADNCVKLHLQLWGDDLDKFGLRKRKYGLMGLAPLAVKKELRKQGKTFVVQPGETNNTIQVAMDALSKALDAPKMAGLKEWVAEWCPEYTWVDPVWPEASAINKLKEDVLFGQLPFGNREKFYLGAYLGLEEYNKFVREYNGTPEK